MSSIVHARIDKETDKVLREIERRRGWSDSRVIREDIKALNGLLVRGKRRHVIGLGRFSSGLPDLGSAKEHLKGFGR